MATAEQTQRRMGCLGIWLAVMILTNLYAIFEYATGGLGIYYRVPDAPLWAYYLFLIATGVAAVGAVGVWLGQRWGLYTFVIAYVVSQLAAILQGTTIMALHLILGLFVLYALLRGRWQAFT
ncbi:MAG: hypothetical protein HZC41_23170 [Chloroflexi bacterium]|nr:hypothetical protein [Chloroflexota bacterium]